MQIDYDNLVIGEGGVSERDIMLDLTTKSSIRAFERLLPNTNRSQEFYKALAKINIDDINYLFNLRSRLEAETGLSQEYQKFKKEHPFIAYVAVLRIYGILDENFKFNQDCIIDLSQKVEGKPLQSKIKEGIIFPNGKMFVVKEQAGHDLISMWLNMHGIDVASSIRYTSDAQGQPYFSTLGDYVKMDDFHVIKITLEQAQALYNIYKSKCNPYKRTFEQVMMDCTDLGFGVYGDTQIRRHNGLSLQEVLGSGIFNYDSVNSRCNMFSFWGEKN